MDTGIEHTEIADMVEAVADIDLIAHNLVVHRVLLQVDCRIRHRSAHQERSDGHNSHSVKQQELGLPEAADFVHNWYKMSSFQKRLYYSSDKNVVREAMLQ